MFQFKVKKKRTYQKGVLVIGEIQHGELFYDEDVIVRVGIDYYHAHIDSIINNYPQGEKVYACSHGTNVGIFLSNIDYHKIILGKTIIEGEPSIDEPVITHTSSKKVRKTKVRKNTNKILPSSLDVEKDVEDKINYPLSSKDQSRHICPVAKGNTTSKISALAPHDKTIIDNNVESNKTMILSSSSLQKLTSEEKEFISDIKHCLKDGGKISPTEFYILDKIRTSLSIKKSRAKELISITMNDYSLKQNEIEYRDAVSLCLLDSNFITSNERFLLDKLRISLHIDQAKAYDIERNCQWILEIEEGKS